MVELQLFYSSNTSSSMLMSESIYLLKRKRRHRNLATSVVVFQKTHQKLINFFSKTWLVFDFLQSDVSFRNVIRNEFLLSKTFVFYFMVSALWIAMPWLYKIISGERRSSAKLNTCQRYNFHHYFYLHIISRIGLTANAHRSSLFFARAYAPALTIQKLFW